MENGFLEMLWRTENALTMVGCWSLLSGARKLFPKVFEKAWIARMHPALPVVLCVASMWLPGLQPAEMGFGARLMLGIVLGSACGHVHKTVLQGLLGSDKRIAPEGSGGEA